LNRTISRVTEKERTYVAAVIDGAFRSSTGAAFMTRLENAFAAKFGSRYAISMVNGTATMHAALEAAGVGSGD
jgi:perosamine synthetase